MGTPKNNIRKSVQLTEMTVSEKLKALSVGGEINMDFTATNLTVIFETVVKILLPLVEWLDKEVHGGFGDRRAMSLINSQIFGFASIMLQRSGDWLVFTPDVCQSIGSADFAKLVAMKSDNLSTLFGDKWDKEMIKFMEDNSFLKHICQRHYLVWLLSEIFNSVENQIKEREARLQIMKQRLSVFHEFETTLDPFTAKEEPLKWKEYSIWDGGHRETGDYLSPSALSEFWKIAKSRVGKGYRQNNLDLDISSLDFFICRLKYHIGDISRAKLNNQQNAHSLWGYNSGRLPFTKGEITVLQKLAQEIEKKEQ